QPDLLPRGRPRRTLRGVGRAGAVRRRDERGLQIAASIAGCRGERHRGRGSPWWARTAPRSATGRSNGMRGQYTRRHFRGTAVGSLAATRLVGHPVDTGGVFPVRRATAMAEGAQQTGSDATAIRPFQVDVPEAELTELRRRIAATRLPSRELVDDRSQGVQLATIQELARYWATEYDWQ